MRQGLGSVVVGGYGYIQSIEYNTMIHTGGITMTETTATTTYVINGQVMTEAQYRAWLDERRGGSGF